MKTIISFVVLLVVFTRINYSQHYDIYQINSEPGYPIDKVLDINFINLNLGFLTAVQYDYDPEHDRQYVWKTTNGGINWTRSYNYYYPPDVLSSVTFINENTGWFIVGDKLRETTDCGIFWSPRAITTPVGNQPKLRFVDENTGYLLDKEQGKFYKSTNSGYDFFQTVNFTEIKLQDIYVTLSNPNLIYICGIKEFSPNNRPFLAKSINGGLNWSIILDGSDDQFSTWGLYSITGFYNNGQPVVKLSGDHALFRLDNDASLTTLYEWGQHHLINYFNSDRGNYVTNNRIYKTTNQGYSWNEELYNNQQGYSFETSERFSIIGEVAFIPSTGSDISNIYIRKLDMQLNTMYDWSNSYSGTITIDGQNHQTPDPNFLIKGGTHLFSANRYNISGNDTNSIFYYWGGLLNGSMNYTDNQVYFDYEGLLNADYKHHLRASTPNAISNASQLKAFVDTNGVTNLVYESMGGIFYTRSYVSGGVSKFKIEECVSGTNLDPLQSYATFNNSNPFITEIKSFDNNPSYTIGPEENVAVAWERRENDAIKIIYKERYDNQNPRPRWDTPVNQPVITFDAPQNFYAYPKVFTARTWELYDHHLRLILYLKPNGSSVQLKGYAKSHVNSGNSYNFSVDEGNITEFTAKAVYQNQSPGCFDIHFAYKKDGRLYYKHGVLYADPVGLNYVSNTNEDKDLSTLDILQYRGEPDITLRDANNGTGGANMQPVVTFKGQYNVIIKIDNGDGIPTPVNYTYYPVVVRERLASGTWAAANFQYNSSLVQQSPNIEGSKNRDSYILNFKRSSSYQQKVVKWEGSMSSGYNCNPCAYNGTDAKLVRGGLLNQYPQTQKLLKLGNSSPPYELGIQSFEITTNLCKRDDLTDEVNGTVVNDNIKYSFNLGSIMVNSQMIGFDDEIDTTIGDGGELNENLISKPFLLNDHDTLIIGRNASYLDEGDGTFTEVQYTVYLTYNSTSQKFLELARDTVHAGDSIQVEYLEGFIIQNIPNGSDSFCVQLEIDTVWAGDGDDFGMNNISNDEDGEGDNTAMKRYVFWKNANVVTNNIPTAFNLYQNFPNPFNPLTKIKYDLPKNVNVTVKVYDLLGREVAILVNNEFKTAGRYEINWNAINFASGVYIYRIQAGDYVSTKKMVLMK